MKKYLMGLGAMALGAGIMFWFTQSEVRAKTWGEWNCSTPGEKFIPFGDSHLLFCERRGVKCTVLFAEGDPTGISCVKSGLF
jgi:hypothetical protein